MSACLHFSLYSSDSIARSVLVRLQAVEKYAVLYALDVAPRQWRVGDKGMNLLMGGSTSTVPDC